MKIVKGSKTANRRNTSAPVAVPAQTSTQSQPQSLAVTQNQPTLSAAKPAKAGGATSRTVTIKAKIDVGFGNTLYLRGEGRGLSWNHGIPLKCVDDSTWQWSGEAEDSLKFKLLLNDSVWSKGEDLIAAPGERLEISPSF